MENNLHLSNKLYLPIVVGIAVLLGLGVFNSFYVFGLGDPLNLKIDEANEVSAPAILELTIIESSCQECFNSDSVLAYIQSNNVELTSENSLSADSLEAKELIIKYNILRLPAIILHGEIDKASLQGFELIDDSLIFSGVTPPYVDANTLAVVGIVSAIVIEDSSCEVCSGFDIILANLRQSGIFIQDEDIVEYSTQEGTELITQYNLSKVPALLLSDEINLYEGISQSLQQSGLQVINGYYVIESVAPYVEPETGNIRGLVNLIMLDDMACEDCYDVEIHKQILGKNLGLEITEEEIVDSSSSRGEEIISKYSITQIPTAIISGDLAAYLNFDQIWENLGTIEEDGSYVFRQLNLLGGISYMDLLTGELVVPNLPSPPD